LTISTDSVDRGDHIKTITGRTSDKGKMSLLRFSTDTSMPGKGVAGSTFGLVRELKSKA
jgi:hypothetical protein